MSTNEVVYIENDQLSSTRGPGRPYKAVADQLKLQRVIKYNEMRIHWFASQSASKIKLRWKSRIASRKKLRIQKKVESLQFSMTHVESLQSDSRFPTTSLTAKKIFLYPILFKFMHVFSQFIFVLKTIKKKQQPCIMDTDPRNWIAN